MGISDRKRSIESPVNINLDLNQEPKPNQLLVDNNLKSGDFVSRKKSGNIFAGSKLNVDGQGIYNLKIIKGLTKVLPKTQEGNDGTPPTPTQTQTQTPTNTPTQTLTNTPTQTQTQTVTPTPTFPLCGVQLNSVNYVSGTTWQYNFVSSVQCGTLSIQYSTDNLNWTTSSGGCTSPRTWDIGIQTDTIYFRVIQICSSGGPTTSNVITYTFPTPTPTATPTATPTPTLTPTNTPTLTPTATPTPTLPPSFVSVWRTTSPSESITLPYNVSGAYSGTIDWGDGFVSANTYANRTHTYSTPGDYTVTIYGVINIWSFSNAGDKLKIREVLRWGPLFIGANVYAFWGCSNLTLSNVVDTLNLTGVQGLIYTFVNCSSITTINNINSWDVSNILSFERMFFGCTSFNDNLSNWNVSKCGDFTGMFNGCSLFNNGLGDGISGTGLNNWSIKTTGSTISMSDMFNSCVSFNQDISYWNMSKVNNIFQMFYDVQKFNQPIGNWERTTPDVSSMSAVTIMGATFRSAVLFNQPINNWNVSNVVNMSQTFYVASAFNQPLSGWNVSNVITMSFMLGASNYNQNIGNWDVSKVQDMSSMFLNNPSFNNGGSPTINNWNVSGVTNMSNMFAGCISFNQPISGWNVSKVTNMSVMFGGASNFNQNINNWNVSGVTNMSNMFVFATVFNQNIGNWDVSRVTNFNSMFSSANNFNNGGSPLISGWTINTTSGVTMLAMFADADQFNQPIGGWNVSKVTNMSQMFYGNNVFNQPLSGWNVSGVTIMSQMFGVNPSFNQPIGNWDVSKVTNMQEMFYNNTGFNQDIGNWNISGVTNFTDFMTFKTPLTFSTTNLNSIYNGWSTKTPQTGLTINFGSAKYTSASSAGKAILTGSTGSGGYGWTITDGGI
jgi:surface protein